MLNEVSSVRARVSRPRMALKYQNKGRFSELGSEFGGKQLWTGCLTRVKRPLQSDRRAAGDLDLSPPAHRWPFNTAPRAEISAA